MSVAAFGIVAQQGQHIGRLFAVQDVAASLAIGDRLRGEVFGGGDIELLVQDGVSRRIFVHAGGAVADPLAGHENRQFDVELDLAHLEWRGVAVAHQVADQAGILLHPLGAAPVRNPRGLHDGGVVAHVVDDTNEAMIQHRDGLKQHRLQRRHGRAEGRGGARACVGDFSFLLLGV